MKRSGGGFTLVELMVVVAIITVLVGIVWVVLGPAREQARRVPCTSNLHQIGLALAMYRGDYGGVDAMEGVAMHAADVGLPSGDQWFQTLTSQYIKSRAVLFCPEFSRDTPKLPMPGSLPSSYWWDFSADAPPIPPDARFSHRVAQRGDAVVIVHCDLHNPKDPWKAPHWESMREIVLRLNGQVRDEILPVRAPFETW